MYLDIHHDTRCEKYCTWSDTVKRLELWSLEYHTPLSQSDSRTRKNGSLNNYIIKATNNDVKCVILYMFKAHKVNKHSFRPFVHSYQRLIGLRSESICLLSSVTVGETGAQKQIICAAILAHFSFDWVTWSVLKTVQSNLVNWFIYFTKKKTGSKEWFVREPKITPAHFPGALDIIVK